MPTKAKAPKKARKPSKPRAPKKSEKPAKAKAPKKSLSRDSSGIEPENPLIIQLTQTVNHLISYTEDQFKKINLTLDQFNQRLENLESINKVKPVSLRERKRIKLDTEKLLKIAEELSRNREKDYITFYELRQYIARWYIVENKDWEQYLEILKKTDKIEFSKGAKADPTDEGYKDSFNKVYYYFKLK